MNKALTRERSCRRMGGVVLAACTVLGAGCLTAPVTGADVPEWFLQTRTEPGLICGKACADIRSGDVARAELEARQSALKDAAAGLYCRVSGETITRQEEALAAGRKGSAQDYFSDESRVVTDLEVAHYRVLKSSKDRNRVYVMVGIPQSAVREIYRLRIERGMTEVAGDFQVAESQRQGQPREAIRTYERCLAHIQALGDDLKVYITLNDGKDDVSKQLPVPERVEVEKRLVDLAGRTPKTLSEIAEELLAAIPWDSLAVGEVVICPLEFDRTGLVSAMGHDLADTLAERLVRRAGWKVSDSGRSADARYVARGNISELQQGAYVTVQFRDRENRIAASAQTFVNSNTCASIGWDRIRPAGWGQELLNKLALHKAVVNDERLTVALQTDKMQERPIYVYGDKPQLFVKVNRECYVTLFDTFSDGTETLLIANHRIPAESANTWVRLPLELEVCEPAGTERLLVQASTAEMPAPPTQRKAVDGGGYLDVIVKTRGLKKTGETASTERNYEWTVLRK